MDPVALVLNSLVGFFPLKEKDDNLQVQMACVNLLDGLHRLAPKIKRSDRKRANLLAVEWKGKLSDAYKDSTLAALGFLHLVVIFELLVKIGIDYLFDLLVLLIRRMQSDELCQSFGLEDMLPDFVNKLGHKGKQIEAIRLVSEFNLMDKCSPSSLLDAYVKGAKSASKRVRKKYKFQLHQIEAITEEIDALKIAIKIAEDYKLCAAYECEKFHNRIEHLEKLKEEIKHTAISIGIKQSEMLNKEKECTANVTGIKHLEKQTGEMKGVATASLASDLNAKGQMHNQHQPNKRLRLSASAVSAPSPPHEHTQFTLVHQAPYMSSGGPYSLVEAPAIYGHVGVSYYGNPIGFDGPHYLQNPHLSSSQSLLGSGYYDNYKAVPSGGYPSVKMKNNQNEDRAMTEVWSKIEEDALIIALKDICAKGWRAANGTFKEGYLTTLEKAIANRLPGAMIKANPNIESKITIWKKYYACLTDMLNTPGFGWNDEQKRIVADSDFTWEIYSKRDKEAKNIRNNSFPYFEDWKEIFGKDGITGELTARSMDSLSDFAKVLSTFCKDTKESLSLMATRIGHEVEVSANRGKVVRKLSTLGLDIEKELKATMLIASDVPRMDVFFSLDDTRLVKWVEMLLDGKI